MRTTGCRAAGVLVWLALLALASSTVVKADSGGPKDMGTEVVDHYVGTGCCLFTYDMAWQPFRDNLRIGLIGFGGWRELPTYFPKDELNCVHGNIEKIGGVNFPDMVDLFLWSGHSILGDATTGSCLHLSAEHFPGATCECGRDCGNVYHSEVELGANDSEVSIFQTCDWMKNYNQQWIMDEIKYMHKGDHLQLGYASHAYNGGQHTAAWAGTYLAQEFLGVEGSVHPSLIWEAWRNTVRNWQPHGMGVYARISLWLGDCNGDYLQGNWMGLGYGGQPPKCDAIHLSQFDFLTYPVP